VIRSFESADFPLELLLERKQQTVTVVLPAREVADAVGAIVDRVLGIGELVDQVLVVDDSSEDGTADVAAAAGADVLQQGELMAEFGPVLGKGDGMWRALAAARGELIVYVDADTRDFGVQFVTGLVGPLICLDDIALVKGAYRRPFVAGTEVVPDGGGRVNWLTAKPLLGAFYPDLASLVQPLAGEIAAPKAVLEGLPFSTGYAVETAMLLDVRERHGAGAIVQVDIGERLNAHQPLPDLLPMASVVLHTFCDRLWREGRLTEQPSGHGAVERPPFASTRASVG
jgi:glucosyl-3-phosphoglycerate synthase